MKHQTEYDILLDIANDTNAEDHDRIEAVKTMLAIKQEEDVYRNL